MEVLAYMNHGRWIVDCPKCGKNGATLAEQDKFISPYSCENGEFICPNCYTGMVVRDGTTITGQVKFNITARMAAQARAKRNGEIYKVVFPKDKKKIEAVVKLRRLDNQNWMPGETLEDLRQENIEHEVR